MQKKGFPVIVMVAAAIFIGILVNGLNGKAKTTQPGDRAIAFTLKDVHGKDYKLSDYRGDVVVINFFTTWCEPCLEEASELEAFGTEYKEAHLLVLAKGESQQRVKKYIAESGSRLTYLLDTKEEAAKGYSVTGQPETIIIDKTGKIAKRISGPTTEKKLISIVEKLR